MRRPYLLMLPVLLFLSGCPSTEPPPDPIDLGDGVDPSIPASEGEARAGRVRSGGEAALFGGIAAEGQVGDFVIYNRLVRFVIQDAYRSHGYIDTGGAIIDADLVRPEGQLGRDPIDDLFISHGIGWLFHAEDVAVVASGADGGEARVRATGGLVRWTFIEGAVESSQPVLPEVDVSMVVDYVLDPDSYTVRVEATYTNDGRDVANLNPSLGWLASDEDLWAWASGQGLDPDDLDEIHAVGAVGRYGEATFSFWPDEGLLRSLGIAALVSSAGISATTMGWTEVVQGESLSFARNITVAPDALTAEAERLAGQGLPTGTVSGEVLGPNDAGIAGVRVWFVEAEADPPWVAGFAVTDADGTFEGEVPPGDWDLYAVGRAITDHVELPAASGRYAPFAAVGVNARQLDTLTGTLESTELELAAGWPTPDPVRVAVTDGGSASASFVLAGRGTLAVDVTNDDGEPIPAYAEVHFADDTDPAASVPPDVARHLGIESGTRFARIWLADGHAEIAAPEASYTVAIEHSWRHTRATVAVDVLADATATTTTVLTKQVPHDGWLAMDSHLHAAPSNDGSLAMEHRLIACAATGVDLPVNTDHDRMADYRPLATALGLDDRLNVIPGVEVSPVVRGHFNLFPVDPDPLGQINGGAEPWWEIPEDQDELLARIRAAGTENSLIQVNHGRSGMFEFASYGPQSGGVGDPNTWSWEFDVFELINGSGRGDFHELRADWFSFLNQGRMKFPTGVSDSHGRTSPCGYGRTDVFLDTDDPSSVTPAQLHDAIAAGHTIVAGGVTLRVDADGSLPGDTLVGGTHSLSARVLGPDWLRPDELRLVRNGETVDTVAVPAEQAVVGVWLEHTFEIDADDDAWFIVEAEGSAGLGGVWRGGVPYAGTNAFLVDVDGDGWDAPGL